ncbi:MAG TPA: HAD-IB family phosphatase [Candidatus Thermoplasmatota archaeon]|nr:HAD-IB family phosphatase [Candidatus Thermoplasmatota archaeon]
MELPAFPPGVVFLEGGRERVLGAVRDRADAPYDLVLFDMDGTLVDEMSSWEFVHEHFQVSNDANWARYNRGEIDDLEFMRTDIALWGIERRPIHLDDVARVLERAPIMRNAPRVMRALRDRGVATGIVSGGMDILAHRVAEALEMDLYLANGLAADAQGYLTGEGVLFIEIRDKGAPTRSIVRASGAAKERTASVGNSRWDVTMFRETGFGVAINPFDDEVRKGANVTVEGTDMLPVLEALLAE